MIILWECYQRGMGFCVIKGGRHPHHHGHPWISCLTEIFFSSSLCSPHLSCLSMMEHPGTQLSCQMPSLSTLTCQHVCSHVLKCIHALTHSNCMSLAMNSLLNLNSLPDNFHWQSSRISISKRNMLNSCFPNFSSHSISQLSKWQLLWESISLIFSHPLSNPLSSYWLHIPSISESRSSSPPPSALVWIIIKATRLPLLPDLPSSVSSWLSSQSNPLKMWDKSCHSTTAHPEGNENSTISMWYASTTFLPHLPHFSIPLNPL